MTTRRRFAGARPIVAAGAAAGTPSRAAPASYDDAVAATWRHGGLEGLQGATLARELVRYATLAPSSHNTQCWKFRVDDGGRSIAIVADATRRCPAVDPDDHHLFVSLGCAAENLVQAASACGLHGEAHVDAARDTVTIALTPTAAHRTPLFDAIPQRQSTRGLYDAKPLDNGTLRQLEAAGRSERVGLLLLTERAALADVLDFVVQGNTSQVNDAAFVAELKSWIRFNEAEALRHGDGLFARSAGNPTLPSWLAPWVFGLVFTAKAENDKIARQLRSSAGVAVFAARAADKAHWVDVGRAFERFALQASALGVRTAHLNQPVEVAALRASFAKRLGLGDVRPDLVIRFGRGPALPPSLRRPLEAVLV